LTGIAPNLTYVPDANYNGADSFQLTVTDTGDGTAAALTSAPATVSVNVNPVNDAPTLGGVPATAAIDEQLPYTFTASASDIDLPAQTLTFSLVGAPAGASINPATGAFSWTPGAAQVGHVYTFGVRVTDNGTPTRYAEEQIAVGVAYTWSGVLPPVSADGSFVFKQRRTVPIKFALTGASGGINNAVAKLLIFKVANNVVGSEIEANSTSAATTGNLFRYDPSAGQYIFNLGTTGLSAGTYQLRIDLGDGVVRAVNFALRP
jgi:hypothetical protein